MREFVVRLMYCEMLGHDVSWGYIHAINMTQVLTSHCCWPVAQPRVHAHALLLCGV
jgi:hypothetical protein